MTLSNRNYFFKGGIIFAALSLLLVTLGGYFAFPAFPVSTAAAALRSRGIIQKLLESGSVPSAYVPYWTALGAVVYSFTGIILIYYFFEKTQSPEILFFGFFVISLSLEAARIVIPLEEVFSFPAMYQISASRALLFGRYLGLFSLFAASVYAAGLDVQKQKYLVLMAVLAALIISANVPIDSLVWDTSLKMLNGYASMLLSVETGILIVTVITFIISAHTRGSRSYLYIGIGSFLTFAGRNILVNSDTWITPLPGLALLTAGIWIICSRLHREYLWF